MDGLIIQGMYARSKDEQKTTIDSKQIELHNTFII